jgi:hypothetical protein
MNLPTNLRTILTKILALEIFSKRYRAPLLAGLIGAIFLPSVIKFLWYMSSSHSRALLHGEGSRVTYMAETNLDRGMITQGELVECRLRFNDKLGWFDMVVKLSDDGNQGFINRVRSLEPWETEQITFRK